MKCFEVANAAEALQEQILSETNFENIEQIKEMLHLCERELNKINSNGDEDIEDIKEYVFEIIDEGYRIIIRKMNELE